MEEINLKSWVDYPVTLDKIKNKYESFELEGVRLHNDILYRGHSSSEWKLKTTLERVKDEKWDIVAYLNLTLRCLGQIETYTNRTWNLHESDSIIQSLIDQSHVFGIHLPDEVYKYWVYLRHHGFPSPLLDWTKSPYIAAFFAYCDNCSSDYVSVFAYIEYPTGAKGGRADDPKITTLGPYLTAHERHFLQQCWYTMATKPSEKNYEIVSHHDPLELGDSEQDLVIKINLPACDRNMALKALHEYNISSYSLFQSPESLMKTLAFNEIELDL